MRNDLHVTGIQLKKLSYLEKKALNIPHTVFVFIDIKTERSTWSSIVQKVCVLPSAYGKNFVRGAEHNVPEWNLLVPDAQDDSFVTSSCAQNVLVIALKPWLKFTDDFVNTCVINCDTKVVFCRLLWAVVRCSRCLTLLCLCPNGTSLLPE